MFLVCVYGYSLFSDFDRQLAMRVFTSRQLHRQQIVDAIQGKPKREDMGGT